MAESGDFATSSHPLPPLRPNEGANGVVGKLGGECFFGCSEDATQEKVLLWGTHEDLTKQP